MTGAPVGKRPQAFALIPRESFIDLVEAALENLQRLDYGGRPPIAVQYDIPAADNRAFRVADRKIAQSAAGRCLGASENKHQQLVRHLWRVAE
jgi:hypothetical protein